MSKIMDVRHKTDIRIPKELYGIIEVTAKDVLGVPVNAFFAIAAAHYVGVVKDAAVNGKKRHEILKTLVQEFQKVVDKALKAA